MTDEQLQLLAIKGAISEMEPGDQRLIQCAAAEIQAVLDAYGENGVIALGLVGSKLAAEQA